MSGGALKFSIAMFSVIRQLYFLREDSLLERVTAAAEERQPILGIHIDANHAFGQPGVAVLTSGQSREAVGAPAFAAHSVMHEEEAVGS